MEDKRRWVMPSFGSWEYFGEEDLFTLPLDYTYCVHCHRKIGVGVEKGCSKERKQRKKGSVDFAGARRAPMAVDEDLYKIPAELLYTEPKRETMLRTFLWGCIGSLNCIR